MYLLCKHNAYVITTPWLTQTEHLITPLIMSKTFALFLLENANNGNEILQVLDDIVEVEYTPL